MAMFVPVLTTIGGGSAVAGGVILATTVGAGVAGAVESRRAGKFAQAQSEIDAKAEGDNARERQIKRKRALLRSISSRQALAGAQGVSFSEGSNAAITQLDIDEANDDLIIDRANTRQRQSSLRAQGRNARIAGNNRAAVSLLDTAKKTASLVL